MQGIAHPVGAHRDAVTDTDGIESHPYDSRLRHANFYLFGQLIEVHVACVALVPDAGDADLGLVHVGFGHTHAVEHSLGRTLALDLRDAAAETI